MRAGLGSGPAAEGVARPGREAGEAAPAGLRQDRAPRLGARHPASGPGARQARLRQARRPALHLAPHLALSFALALLLAGPAAAQRPGCGFGEGLAALREAEARLHAPITGLLVGREAAAAAGRSLGLAAARFSGCGCPRAAEAAGEAGQLAEAAAGAAEVARLQPLLDRAGFSARLAREGLGRRGCS
ncbi:hypothetical protein [Siccirubricoccus phaeus]|uniref:hypothetical protein n=1 Tax=Siccirubricoccus phaeus TaxID=2595053 RepID=UPI0011F174D4|nr:hypothetical protein [Siccirubricoccus phaeus]